MAHILITGATGNVGEALIYYLYAQQTNHRIIAGVRDIDKAKERFQRNKNLEYRTFDFENRDSFPKACEGIDILFLLRPPHIADVERYFKPLIAQCKHAHIKQVVFLSVQGADKSSLIPHGKIEKLLIAANMEYVFIRPSYFMQNLLTTLYNDIQKRNKIFIPAGNALFNWIDVENIAEVCAIVLNSFDAYKNKIIELTGEANISFKEVAKLINQIVKSDIVYKSPSILRFFFTKQKEGMDGGRIFVLIMLHYIARFSKEPQITNTYYQITGKYPVSLKEFIEREKLSFLPMGVN